MNRGKYTTIHDLKDIVSIYRDCQDYDVKFWNFTDYNYMKLQLSSICISSEDSQNTIILECYPALSKKDNRLNIITIDTVANMKGFIRYIEEYAKTHEYDLHDLDDARIMVYNIENHKWMRICFTGSSNVTKEVNYSIDYIDPGWYLTMKRKYRMKYMLMSYRIKNYFNNFFLNFKQ